jgi:hypothetical protein
VGPGPIEEGLLWLQTFTGLQAICGARIWCADRYEHMVALTRLTHLEFTLRNYNVPAAQLTGMTMLRRLSACLHIGYQSQFFDAIAALTQLEDLTLIIYGDLGQLGSSLPHLTSLALSSHRRWEDYLSALANFNLRGLRRLFLRVNQSTFCPTFSCSVLLAATQLKYLVLDVQGISDPLENKLVAVSQLTTLTHLELSLIGDITPELERLAIRVVATLTQLSSLSLIIIPKMSLETLKGIICLTSLTKLQIDSRSVTFGKGSNWLTRLTRLEVLDRPSHLFEQNAALLRPLWQLQYRRGMRLVNSCYADVLGSLGG